MKVLWLVSITIPAAADACGLQAKEIGGGWLSGALGGMTAAPDAPAITVASVDARAETLTVCSKNGVSFALVPTGSVENFSALLKKIAPDLVHIWGTEYAAARTIQQAAQAAGIPVLVGIQGVMVDCALHLNDGVPARLLHSCAAQHLIDRHVPGGLLDVNQARFDTLAQSEAAVLANARHVTGRTSFDRSAVKEITPANKNRTQVAVNSEGKTNEATKKVKEPLKKGQDKPTEKQKTKQDKKEKQEQTDKPKQSRGRKR